MFAALASAMEEEDVHSVMPSHAKPKKRRQKAAEVLQELLPDPLAILQAKDEFIQSAAAAARAAKVAAITTILQQAAPANTSADAAVPALAAPTLDPQPPNLPAVRPGLAHLRSKYHEAVQQGNTYLSPETIHLSLGLIGGQPAVPEAAIKPQPNFNLTAARTQEALRPATLKDGAMGSSTGIMEAIKQPVDQRHTAATDPILQNLTPNRPPEKAFEDYNFCSEMKRGTLSPSVPLKCIQERFIGAGGKPTGALFPATKSPAYYTFYSQPTFGEMMLLIERVASKLHSANKAEQAQARYQLYGDVSPTRPASAGAELFIRVGQQRMLIRRRILSDSMKVPPLVAHDVAGGSADYLLIANIWSETPRRWRWAQKTSHGMITIVEKELWDFETQHADIPGDFRNLVPGKYIANSVTPIRPLAANYVRCFWSNNPEDELLIEDADDAGADRKEPQSIGKELLFLTQERGAPMLSFAVYERERKAPPSGVYGQPQFSATFGSGLRFEEYRNPDIFYSLSSGVEIDTRPRQDLADAHGFAVFKSKSFWQCTTPVSPCAWRTITFTVTFDNLPTAGREPMRCVAAAYPFFLYLSYIPSAATQKQGAYLTLYRLKDNSYVISRVPIQKAVLYFISIDYMDGSGEMGKLRLQVAPLVAARQNVGQLEDSAVYLDLHDDVFYAMMPVEGGSLINAIQMPFISLGFQKYGLGAPGMNSRVGFFHVFDYILGRADYEKEIGGNWQMDWFI
jgi:hypothetical protein